MSKVTWEEKIDCLQKLVRGVSGLYGCFNNQICGFLQVTAQLELAYSGKQNGPLAGLEWEEGGHWLSSFCRWYSLFFSPLSSSAELRVESWAYCTRANTEPHSQPIFSWSFVHFLLSTHSNVLPAFRPTPQSSNSLLADCLGVDTPAWRVPTSRVLVCIEGCLKSEQGHLPSHTAGSCSQAEAEFKGLHQGFLAGRRV